MCFSALDNRDGACTIVHHVVADTAHDNPEGKKIEGR